MKKILYLYSAAIIALLLASSFLMNDTKLLVISIFSIELIIIIFNNIIIKKSNKQIMIEIIVTILFLGYLFFIDNIDQSSIIPSILPLVISITQTLKTIDK